MKKVIAVLALAFLPVFASAAQPPFKGTTVRVYHDGVELKVQAEKFKVENQTTYNIDIPSGWVVNKRIVNYAELGLPAYSVLTKAMRNDLKNNGGSIIYVFNTLLSCQLSILDPQNGECWNAYEDPIEPGIFVAAYGPYDLSYPAGAWQTGEINPDWVEFPIKWTFGQQCNNGNEDIIPDRCYADAMNPFDSYVCEAAPVHCDADTLDCVTDMATQALVDECNDGGCHPQQ